MDRNNIAISPDQAKLILKSLREVEDRLNVVCRICDDEKEIKAAEKQLVELSQLINSLNQQANPVSVKNQTSKSQTGKKKVKRKQTV